MLPINQLSHFLTTNKKLSPRQSRRRSTVNFVQVISNQQLTKAACRQCEKFNTVPSNSMPTGIEAPCPDHVPNMSAKKCHFAPSPEMKKFADLELSSQVGLQISKCHLIPSLGKCKVGTLIQLCRGTLHHLEET